MLPREELTMLPHQFLLLQRRQLLRLSRPVPAVSATRLASHIGMPGPPELLDLAVVNGEAWSSRRFPRSTATAPRR